MIGRLTGTLAAKTPPQVLVDVDGVGYEVDVPMSSFYNLPALGERVTLLTHFVVREDAQVLFGFLTHEERATFRLLVKISGVGPRTALAILSGLSVDELAQRGEPAGKRRASSRCPASARRPPSGCCSSSRASSATRSPRRRASPRARRPTSCRRWSRSATATARRAATLKTLPADVEVARRHQARAARAREVTRARPSHRAQRCAPLSACARPRRAASAPARSPSPRPCRRARTRSVIGKLSPSLSGCLQADQHQVHAVPGSHLHLGLRRQRDAVDLAHAHDALRVDAHRVQLDARRRRRARAHEPVGARCRCSPGSSGRRRRWACPAIDGVAKGWPIAMSPTLEAVRDAGVREHREGERSAARTAG